MFVNRINKYLWENERERASSCVELALRQRRVVGRDKLRKAAGLSTAAHLSGCRRVFRRDACSRALSFLADGRWWRGAAAAVLWHPPWAWHAPVKVRSTTLDVWLPEQVAFMQHTGNAVANAHFEAHLPPEFQRPSHVMDSKPSPALIAFIRAKYQVSRCKPQ